MVEVMEGAMAGARERASEGDASNISVMWRFKEEDAASVSGYTGHIIHYILVHWKGDPRYHKFEGSCGWESTFRGQISPF